MVYITDPITWAVHFNAFIIIQKWDVNSPAGRLSQSTVHRRIHPTRMLDARGAFRHTSWRIPCVQMNLRDLPARIIRQNMSPTICRHYKDSISRLFSNPPKEKFFEILKMS